MPSCISVRRARQHNLRGITLDIPHGRLTVVTGPSGSGKSSLAFDTLYAEGQRRYIESLSSYARQFLERMPKPLVDRIDHILPAVAIQQRNPVTSSRSTVGTATEIHDYLRLLWARAGTAHCVDCGNPVIRDDPGSGARRLLADHSGAPATICFPLPRTATPDHDLLAANLLADGFVRVVVDGSPGRIDEPDSGVRLDTAAEVLVAVDRITLRPATRNRLTEALRVAFTQGDGVAVALLPDGEHRFRNVPACTACGRPGEAPTPTLFSFNSPRGACPTCNGFGAVLEYHETLVVPDPERTLDQGAIDPWTKPRYGSRRRLLHETAVAEGIPTDVPWARLPDAARTFLLEGRQGRYVGIFPFLRGLERKRYKQYVRVFLRQYQLAIECESCHGARLRSEALTTTVGGRSIAEVSALPAAEVRAWLAGLDLPAAEGTVADTVLPEITRRIGVLCDVGLEYLSLDRQTRTLSGGESQRIALANALGASLTDTMYVLDEPSIGLHPRDLGRLLDIVLRLRDGGNTVVMVEHDPAAIRLADHMVELGPGSGAGGGELVFAGRPGDARTAGTLTGDYLAGTREIPVPSARRPAGPSRLSIVGATLHNLRGVDVDIPLHTLTVVSGVSGSGKSTLVHDVLYRQLARRLHGRHGAREHLGEPVGHADRVDGWESLDDVVLIDQSPIGRSPRSNPITYVRAFDNIRQLYASQPLARARGLTPTDFSFNAADGGRCPGCDGAGHVQVEMVFMADVFVPCEQCEGTRYRPDILEVRIKGLSIHDVLQLTVDEAIARFRHQERLGKALWHLQQVGLGYLRLGQPGTTLSGGEAQRLKIARQLAGAGKRGHAKGRGRLYLLDEPTTGLHLDDVRTLLRVLDRLVDAGHTVLVIEHHLDVIKRADWVIDLGPDGGQGGGRVVATGPPETIAAADTHTGRYLREALAEAAVPG